MKEIIIVLIFAFFVSLNGCGDKSEVSGEKKDLSAKEEKKDEGTSSKDTELKEKKESNSSTEAASEEVKTNELGMTPGMPSNFPSDVPQPKNAKVIGSLTSSEGTMVTFESNDKVQSIIDFYKTEMKNNGYTVSEDGELITPDKGGLINWKKQGKEVQLVLGYDEDKKISSLVITYK